MPAKKYKGPKEGTCFYKVLFFVQGLIESDYIVMASAESLAHAAGKTNYMAVLPLYSH